MNHTHCLVLLAALAFPLLAQDSRPDTASRATSTAETVTLEGRVVDLRGEGIALAEVAVSTTVDFTAPLARGVCDGDGYFRIPRVPHATTWVVQGSAPGFCKRYATIYVTPSPVRIRLHEAAVVRGTLFDRKGQPVAGVPVCADLEARILRGERSPTITDAHGRFAIPHVPLGPGPVYAFVPGEGVAETPTLLTGDADLVVTPSKRATTSLRLVVEGLPEGDPIKVTISPLAYDHGSLVHLPPPFESVQIRGNGAWTADLLPDLQYRVSAYAKGFAFAPSEARFEQGRGPHEVHFKATAVGSPELRCEARVVDPDGHPLPGLRMEMRALNGSARSEAATGPDGVLSFASKLAAGTGAIVTSLDEAWVVDRTSVREGTIAYATRSSTVQEFAFDPGRRLELRVVPACLVRGRVLQADGAPARFVAVGLESEEANRMPRWMEVARATTDRDGAFTIRGLHHLENEVRLRVDSDLGSLEGEPFALGTAGTRVAHADLKLLAPARVEGIVRDGAGKPRPGIRVWLRDWDLVTQRQVSGSIVEVITDRAGRYRFASVPVGGAYLQAFALRTDPTLRAVEPFEVAAGETCTHDLVVRD